MPTIDTENTKSIRQKMSISVILGTANDPILTLTDDDIISCELNLRSDLKPIDPTLPESEIVITAYWPEDLTDEALDIKEDTVITYQAGYSGDMSPVRTFYLSERIEWEDNVLTIKGVDAVHFLDYEIRPIGFGYTVGSWTGGYIQTSSFNTSNKQYFYKLLRMMQILITGAGVSLVNSPTLPPYDTSRIGYGGTASVIERQNARELIANMMNLLHQDYESGFFTNYNSFWLSYVDAGRPWLDTAKPSSKWNIYEADCADIKRHLDDRLVKIKAANKVVRLAPITNHTDGSGTRTTWGLAKIGRAEIIKSAGASLNYDVLTSLDMYYMSRETLPSGQSDYHLENYTAPQGNAKPDTVNYNIGTYLKDGKNGSGWQPWSVRPTDGPSGSSNVPPFASVNVFTSYLRSRKFVQTRNDETISVDLIGDALYLDEVDQEYTKSGDGVEAETSKTKWTGTVTAGNAADTETINILPDYGFKSLLNRSNETGSFTWKGDPRMQPRDVFTFHYIDGTTELRTIESINLKHEGGGTVAQITYRKGIV